MTEDTDIPQDRWFPLCWGSATDVGRVREHNEDAVWGDPQMGLFLVADGMGGHHGGAMASKVVTTVLPSMLKTRLGKLGVVRNRAYRYWLRRDILKLSQQLRAESEGRAGFHGMGATLVLALVLDKGTHIAHIGDSRAYFFRGGQLTQLTDDHSIVGILFRQGEITTEEAKDHPARGKLSRYVGMEDEVYPDVRTIACEKGDRLLLCSDGLTGMVSDYMIAGLLKDHGDPTVACKTLVDAANAAGGQDNITVLVVDCEGPTSDVHEVGVPSGAGSA